MFDTNGHGLIEVSDLKVALRALGFEPAREELKRLVSDLNKTQQTRERAKEEKANEGQITIDYDSFLDIMTTKMSERDADSELGKAFILFSQNKDHINFEDLKNIAKELGETMSDDELKEMMYQANRTNRDGVVSHD